MYELLIKVDKDYVFKINCKSASIYVWTTDYIDDIHFKMFMSAGLLLPQVNSVMLLSHLKEHSTMKKEHEVLNGI